MIAEAPATTQPNIEAETTHSKPSLSLGSVVASLQVLLATRRAVRNDDHAYWYTVARGL
jgi:hypothetical protein